MLSTVWIKQETCAKDISCLFLTCTKYMRKTIRLHGGVNGISNDNNDNNNNNFIVLGANSIRWSMTHHKKRNIMCHEPAPSYNAFFNNPIVIMI